MGDDNGCFKAALWAVLTWGGVLEHPAHSKAWDAFGLRKPVTGAGWQRSDMGHPSSGYAVCYVEQGHYGHASRKPTWLLANVHPGALPDLDVCLLEDLLCNIPPAQDTHDDPEKFRGGRRIEGRKRCAT